MYWQLTFRNLNRAETVRLETITDSEVEARKLAAIHLESIGRPLSAFVSVRPMCAARSHDFRRYSLIIEMRLKLQCDT